MSRANRILAIALAAIVVLAVVAAVISGTRSAPEVEPGSPEATVQGYVDAALAGRYDEAARLLEPGSDCDAADLEQLTGMGMHAARVVLVDSAVEGSTATVQVDLVYASGGPFDTSEYTERHTYRLVRSGGGWLLTGVPWPLFECWKE
ncbi:MAG TPA: hypothetical protein VFT81_05805 [Dermatophilaceae bacterium]|nr:hypothetical protein [Dermatophilaceae bacterium]